jgi:hypothetical protein
LLIVAADWHPKMVVFKVIEDSGIAACLPVRCDPVEQPRSVCRPGLGKGKHCFKIKPNDDHVKSLLRSNATLSHTAPFASALTVPTES